MICTTKGIENEDRSGETFIRFEYKDCDTLFNELSEFYSYAEVKEFDINSICFYNFLSCSVHAANAKWTCLNADQKHDIVEKLLCEVDVMNKFKRLLAVRSILYLIQGVYEEAQNSIELARLCKENILMFCEKDGFESFVNLLRCQPFWRNSYIFAEKKYDNIAELRCILNVIYTVIQFLINYKCNEIEWLQVKEQIQDEISSPSSKNEMLIDLIFQLLQQTFEKKCEEIPVAKCTLLIWKLILFTLGGVREAFVMKNIRRKEFGLPEITEDPSEIIRNMKPHVLYSRGISKSKAPANENQINSDGISDKKDDPPGTSSPTFELKQPLPCRSKFNDKKLPWKPKATKADLLRFLNNSRKKNFGFSLDDDYTTTDGLPAPVVASFEILKCYLYVPLSEKQIALNEMQSKYPFTLGSQPVTESKTEKLYSTLLPKLQSYIVILMNIFLSSLQAPNAKTDLINLVSELTSKDLTDKNAEQILGADITRHKSIILKAISSIILLLMKHLKVNHIYQYDYFCHRLVFSTCIQLILRYLSQDIAEMICPAELASPLFVYQEYLLQNPRMSLQDIKVEIKQGSYSWRILFTTINFLRVLNKLCKGKQARISVLVLSKSVTSLKNCLKVKETNMHYYTLKLIKMQSHHLGRQWRKSNMAIFPAIYQKVRHRINDDWACGNGMEVDSNQPQQQVKSTDLQKEEIKFRQVLEEFHRRRYNFSIFPSTAVHSETLEETFYDDDSESLPFWFTENVDEWLKHEVFERQIDWDALCSGKKLLVII